MIQRIQTIYLFFAAVAAFLLVLFPPMSFMTSEEATEQKIYTMDIRHVHEMMYDANDELVHAPHGALMDTWGLAALAMVVGVLSFADIFLYRKRILQARLNVFTIICALGYYGMMAMYAWLIVKRFDVDWYLEWSSALPLVIIILLSMAIHRILADEALVRSANRLR